MDKNMKKIMSSWSLRSDAREYESLSRQNRRKFSLRRYNRICKLEEKAYTRLQELEGDEMEITSKNIKAWVSYIQAFSSEKYKSRLYKKLQPYADFDVKQYAEMQELSWLERITLKLFPKDRNKPLYLNAKQMKKSMNEYRRADRLLQRDPWKYDYCHETQDDLRDNAKIYAQNILDDKVELTLEDCRVFPKYMETVCPYTEADMIKERVLDKVQQLSAQKELAAQEAEKQENSKKTPQMKTSFWKRAKQALKVIAVTAVVALGGLLGTKSCGSKQSNSEQINKNIVVTPKADKKTVTEIQPQQKDTCEFLSVADLISSKPDQKSKVQVAAAAEKDSLQKVWKNYYDNTIEILSSKAQKDSLYRKIDEKLSNKVFSLPDSISKENVAYAYVIYKAYGLEAPLLEKAMQSQTNLSTQDQANLVSEVLAAGKKGEGAKKMAAQRHKGNLSKYSKFNKASHHLQQQHVKTLKDLKLLQKKAHSR